MARKVMFFTYGANYGGDDTVLIQLVRSWVSREDKLTVALNSDHPGRDFYAEKLAGRAEIVLLHEAIEPFFPRLSRPWRLLGSLLRLRKFVRNKSPDVLIISSGGYPLSALTLRFLWAAWWSRVPRIVLVLHNYPHWGSGYLRASYLRSVSWFPQFLCDHVVSVSRDCAQALAPYFRHRGAVLHIYNGIELRSEVKDKAAKKLDLGGPKGPVIGAIGNFEDRKGFRYLILAMKKILLEIPETSLVIIGARVGPGCYERLCKLVAEMNIQENVYMPGFIPDAGQYAECFDVCVIPSVTHESFGLMALEAMQYRKPVVATTVGGLPEVVADRQTGRLIPPSDPDALAAAVLELLRSSEKARSMGEAGRRQLLDNFTADRMAQKYYDLTLARRGVIKSHSDGAQKAVVPGGGGR